MTGTVLAGSIKVSDMVEIPALKVERKVKSLQMFHKPSQVRCVVRVVYVMRVFTNTVIHCGRC